MRRPPKTVESDAAGAYNVCMDIIIAFGVFIAAVVAALVSGVTVIAALAVGLAAFVVVALRRGFGAGEVAKMVIGGSKEALIVIKVMMIVGILTASWRASGTITVFIEYGVRAISPHLFLIVTFLLTCLLSYALGTCFGVAGTVGVIFMALARSGGVDPLVTAGVIMSGLLFGDRGSPVSSCAITVAAVTGTELMDNIRKMMQTAVLPLAITFAVCAALSWQNPIGMVDTDLLSAMHEEHAVSLWAFLPAVLILLLPMLKVDVVKSMLASIAAAGAVAYFVQGFSAGQLLRFACLGYESRVSEMSRILDGGGMISMVSIVVILVIACGISGIFEEADLLSGIHEKLEVLTDRFGRLPVMTVLSVFLSAVFCNQIIPIMMSRDLLSGIYEKNGASKTEFAIDIENSAAILVTMVPWCLMCSVPLGFMAVGYGAMKYAVYVYAVPICYLLTKKRFAFNTGY